MISMMYLWRVRKLVKVVVDETHIGENAQTVPSVVKCLKKFQAVKPAYNNPLVVRTILAIATQKGYLAIDDSKAINKKGKIDITKQRLKVSGEGLVLLTPTGYLNAIGEAIGNILAIISITVSIIALIVSLRK